jgi:NADH-quinone oxidoreductase subunit N
MITNQFDTETMTDYKGLCRRSLFGFIMALCLGVFMLSLAGIPPFAGFIGKWTVFAAVMKSGLYWLAIIGVINSVISLYYYVRLVKYMFFDEPTSVAVAQNSYRRYATLMIAFAVLSVAFGIYFEPLAQWAKYSASFLY